MKPIRKLRPSPAMVVALLALFVALGGSAFAFGLGRDSVHSANIAPGAVRAPDLGKLRLRPGKVVDRDTTAQDGSYAAAFGHAQCKRGERLISGGLRQRSGAEQFVIGHVSTVEETLIPSKREFAVKMNSDLGGAARKDFVVFAYCLAR